MEKQSKRAILKSNSFYVALILLSAFYYLIPTLCRKVAGLFIFQEYLHLDAPRLSVGIKKSLLWPLGKWLSYIQLNVIAVLWFAIILLVLFGIWRMLRPYWKLILGGLTTLILLLFAFPNMLLLLDNHLPSTSNGHVANGSISNAKRIPLRGPNYTTYSFAAYLAGRTYVNNSVKDCILESYKICSQTCPNITFVLGETGHRKGGNFLPHRTHKNGLSVDFMCPLLKNGKVHRSNHVFNLWGYSFEFDEMGKKGDIAIDFETVAQHLLALDQAAKQQGLILQKVIFDPVLRKQLTNTTCWQKIKHLPFTKNRVAWRHDDHYHVDFGFPSNGRD